MRLVVTALLAGCGFQHGSVSASGDDARPMQTGDARPADARRVDARPADASNVTPLLEHDFEDDLLGQYTGIYLMSNDSVNHGSVAHGGTKSAHCVTASPANSQATLYFNFSPRTELYARMWIRPGSGFPPADYVMIMSFVDDPNGPAWNNIATVDIEPDMRVSVLNSETNQTYTSTAALQPGQWHRIEVRVVASPSAGRLMLAIDGNVQFDHTGLDTGSLTFHRILTGIAWQGSGELDVELFVDDVRLE